MLEERTSTWSPAASRSSTATIWSSSSHRGSPTSCKLSKAPKFPSTTARAFSTSTRPSKRAYSSGGGAGMFFRLHPQLAYGNQHRQHDRANQEDSPHAGVVRENAAEDQAGDLRAENE